MKKYLEIVQLKHNCIFEYRLFSHILKYMFYAN